MNLNFVLLTGKQIIQYFALIHCYITIFYHILPFKFVYTDNIQVCVYRQYSSLCVRFICFVLLNKR